jgi:hypothetical protein
VQGKKRRHLTLIIDHQHEEESHGNSPRACTIDQLLQHAADVFRTKARSMEGVCHGRREAAAGRGHCACTADTKRDTRSRAGVGRDANGGRGNGSIAVLALRRWRREAGAGSQTATAGRNTDGGGAAGPVERQAGKNRQRPQGLHTGTILHSVPHAVLHPISELLEPRRRPRLQRVRYAAFLAAHGCQSRQRAAPLSHHSPCPTAPAELSAAPTRCSRHASTELRRVAPCSALTTLYVTPYRARHAKHSTLVL